MSRQPTLHTSVQQREMEWHDQQANQRHSLNQHLYNAPAFSPVVKSMLLFLDPKPTDRILDLGCGAGRDLSTLAGYGTQVVGMDLASTQLLQARKQLEKSPGTTVMFTQADALRLPFPSCTFDFIFGKAVLHHLDNLSLMVSEILRVLSLVGAPLLRNP